MVRRTLLVVLALTGCRGLVDETPRTAALLSDGGRPADDAGLPSTCAADEECPAGMVCGESAEGERGCVPGCRLNVQCATHFICELGVACTSGPCPPGWCQPDPCRDLDGDGFSATVDPSMNCPGKQVGDCDDSNPRIHPGATEWCANYTDDNCDGKTDAKDPACRTCDLGQNRCNTAYECGFGSRFCDQGCCEACPVPAPVQCQPGECVQPSGVDPATGCALPTTCGACASCSSLNLPVCGANAVTYTNACHAQAVGVDVLHTGACQPGEGTSCPDLTQGWWYSGGCPWGEYCRDSAPDSGTQAYRCTKQGACEADADCPQALGYGVGEPDCADGGVGSYTCVAHACVQHCGP